MDLAASKIIVAEKYRLNSMNLGAIKPQLTEIKL